MDNTIVLKTAQRFIAALTGNSESPVTFQTFDDKKERGRLSRILHGSLSEHERALKSLNQRGAGIFITVNETDLKGRELKNITRVRAFFVDIDGDDESDLNLVTNCALTPHIIVKTSPGRFHAYWLVSDGALKEFTPIQEALIRKFGSDSSVKDLPRVMRLPGFIHQKKAPFRTLIVQKNRIPPYSRAEIIEGLDLQLVEGSKKLKGPALKKSMRRVRYEPQTEGNRNIELFKYCCALRDRGVDEPAIWAAMEVANNMNNPPLDDSELTTITESALSRSRQDYDSITVEEALNKINIPVPKKGKNLAVPAGYEIRREGVFHEKIRKNSAEWEPVSHAPVIICERIQNVESDSEKLKIGFYEDSQASPWISRILPRGTALDCRKIVAEADRGLPVSSETSRPLVKYLAAFEAQNKGQLRLTLSRSTFGYNKNRTSFQYGKAELVTAESVNQKVIFSPESREHEALAAAYRTKGDASKWFQALEQAMKHPRFAVFFYAAMAAPLQRVMGWDNFIVDLSAPTSTGKSIALNLVMSIYGNPAGCVHSVNLTPVFLENVCSLQSGFPLAMDDTKTAGLNLNKMLYDLTFGKSKGRGKRDGGMQERRAWKTIALTTGESSLADYAQDAGARSRILPIKGLPFGKQNVETALFVQKLKALVKGNFGHLGPRWIKYILENRNEWKAWRKRDNEILLEYSSNSGPSARLNEALSCLRFTAELIRESELMTFRIEGDPFEVIKNTIQEHVEKASNSRRAAEMLNDWALQHKDMLYNAKDRQSPPPQGFVGRWDREDGKDDWEYIGFSRTQFEEILKKGGMDPHACKTDLAHAGLLVKNENERSVPTRIDGHLNRLICLKRAAFDHIIGDAKNPKNKRKSAPKRYPTF